MKHENRTKIEWLTHDARSRTLWLNALCTRTESAPVDFRGEEGGYGRVTEELVFGCSNFCFINNSSPGVALAREHRTRHISCTRCEAVSHSQLPCAYVSRPDAIFLLLRLPSCCLPSIDTKRSPIESMNQSLPSWTRTRRGLANIYQTTMRRICTSTVRKYRCIFGVPNRLNLYSSCTPSRK